MRGFVFVLVLTVLSAATLLLVAQMNRGIATTSLATLVAERAQAEEIALACLARHKDDDSGTFVDGACRGEMQRGALGALLLVNATHGDASVWYSRHESGDASWIYPSRPAALRRSPRPSTKAKAPPAKKPKR